MLSPDEVALERKRVISEERNYFIFPHRLVTGEVRTVEVHSSPISFAEKKILFSIIHDITERKKAEESLQRSQAMLARTEGIAHVGSWEWDVEADKVTWSEELFRIFHRSPADGAPSFSEHAELYTPEDVERLRAVVAEAVSNGRPYEIELRAIRKDGETRHCLARGHAEMGPEGRATRLFGSFQDITERKRMEETLRASEERFRTLLEVSPTGFWATDPIGKNTYVSPYWTKMTGISKEDAQGDGWSSGLHPDDKDAIFAGWAQASIHGEPYDSEFRFIQPDGHCVWVLCKALAVKTDEGNIAEWLGTITDITERKRSEEKLRESEEQYRAVVNNLHIGISVINHNMEIVAINPFFAAYFPHVRAGEGQVCYVAYNDPPSSEPCSYCPCVLTFQDGKVHESETDTPAGDRIRHFRIVSCPVKDENGQVELVIELVEDFTERRALYAQLAQAQKMEAVGTLAGGVAHDFNNILQVALGYSELLLGDESLPERYEADLAKIHESAKRGADLVQRLLTFSRKTESKPQPLDLNPRVNEMQKMLERTIPKMIEIRVSLSEDLAKIFADQTQVDQVLMNLAVNARDAMPEGGKLVIETANVVIDEDYARSHLEAKPGRYVLLRVSDTGSGIDKETLEHIFEPFFTTKGLGQGTGLGLAMVFGIVKQHQGFIKCYSEVGHGTTFKIYLPALLAETPPDLPVIPSSLQGGTETILLVDDEELIRDLGKRILSKAGYTVLAASNGREALDLYRSNKGNISLVMLDLIMPGMGGKQCIEGLLKIDPDVKVLVASGYSAGGPTKQALSSGAKGFVAKPFDMRQVLEMVRKTIDEQ